MTLSDTASQPSTLRVNRNLRFWQVQIPLVVLQVCAGNVLLLAAWVATAAALAEDAALQGFPRSARSLVTAVASQIGLQELLVISLLVELEQRNLLVVIDGEVTIPLVALAEASVRAAEPLLVAAEERAAAAATPHRQGTLPGFAV